MGYGNIDALTKPIDTLFALVHSTTRLLNSCLFSFQVCIKYFLFIIVASASPLIFGLRAESGLSNEKTRLVRPVLLSPLEEANLLSCRPMDAVNPDVHQVMSSKCLPRCGGGTIEIAV